MRRLSLISGVIICSILTGCGSAAPKTFVSTKAKPLDSPSSVNVMTAFDEAIGLRRSALAFAVGVAEERRKNLLLFLGSRRAATHSPPESVVTAATPTTSLYPCGGDLPPCEVKQRESGGDYGAVNPSGCSGYSCGGAWQFDPRTWNGYGGYQYAQDAPPEVQDAKARELYAGGAGASHWGVG